MLVLMPLFMSIEETKKIGFLSRPPTVSSDSQPASKVASTNNDGPAITKRSSDVVAITFLTCSEV